MTQKSPQDPPLPILHPLSPTRPHPPYTTPTVPKRPHPPYTTPTVPKTKHSCHKILQTQIHSLRQDPTHPPSTLDLNLIVIGNQCHDFKLQYEIGNKVSIEN
ncbi:unnamed protein product [Gadus morhua 'NCC']